MFITLSFITTLWNIIIFLVVLGVVICIHELGHFFFAKRAGILCHEFSFGMGPRLWSKKFGETVFSIRAIPFGGYVSMAGEEIEADIIKIGQKIRLGFDGNNEVNRIILNSSDTNYNDFIEVKVEEYDLSSEEGTRLYINGYTVKRDAMYVTKKGHLQIAPKDRSFTYKTRWQRFITTFGGPLMNFILAFFVYLIIAFAIGVPNGASPEIGEVDMNMPAGEHFQAGDIILSINDVNITSWDGETNSISSELNKMADFYVVDFERDGITYEDIVVYPQYYFYTLGFVLDPDASDPGLILLSPLYVNSELQSGDRIISIDGIPMNTISDLIDFSNDNIEGSTEENPTNIEIERDGEILDFDFIAYGEDVLSAMGYESYYSKVGITSTMKFSFFGSFGSAWSSFSHAGSTIFRTIGLMFTSNQVGVGDLSGFVGIFSMTSQAAANGIISLLAWVGLLSVNLGIVNLLPIPALDGGRIVFIGYEAITKRRPNQKVENLLHTVMFFLLMALLVFITYNDILRLFGLK
ncbi:RIP metalloprotease RseP [Candidatus Izemoplasma sp. B36]|uniref:RIP metalloprotease RseP n=1 Tax=Candidatus Izemoplasma sp. B36 TaxID=3242468 RepID=UPI0035564A39